MPLFFSLLFLWRTEKGRVNWIRQPSPLSFPWLTRPKRLSQRKPKTPWTSFISSRGVREARRSEKWGCLTLAWHNLQPWASLCATPHTPKYPLHYFSLKLAPRFVSLHSLCVSTFQHVFWKHHGLSSRLSLENKKIGQNLEQILMRESLAPDEIFFIIFARLEVPSLALVTQFFLQYHAPLTPSARFSVRRCSFLAKQSKK